MERRERGLSISSTRSLSSRRSSLSRSSFNLQDENGLPPVDVMRQHRIYTHPMIEDSPTGLHEGFPSTSSGVHGNSTTTFPPLGSEVRRQRSCTISHSEGGRSRILTENDDRYHKPVSSLRRGRSLTFQDDSLQLSSSRRKLSFQHRFYPKHVANDLELADVEHARATFIKVVQE